MCSNNRTCKNVYLVGNPTNLDQKQRHFVTTQPYDKQNIINHRPIALTKVTEKI